jgi:Domain of unknown function (DUF4260)
MSIQSTTLQSSKNISMPRLFLHLEGLALLVSALVIYLNQNFSWGTFALFLLAPDLAIIVYAVHQRSGQIVYNIVHTTIFPLALVLYSIMTSNTLGLQVSLIWFAHIGMDHLFGYGFKYPGSFKETHFSRI